MKTGFNQFNAGHGSVAPTGARRGPGQWGKGGEGKQRTSDIEHPTSKGGRAAGFTLLEVMVSMGLLTLIVLVLMSVFSNTQSAFRAGVTQTDVLANGRATMEMLAADARLLARSGNTFTNIVGGTTYYGAANVAVLNLAHVNQLLPASGSTRTNIIQSIFFLGRENTKWKGIGYVVNVGETNAIFPLYRFYEETNVAANPGTLYTNFLSTSLTNTTVWSHLMDGVVHLVVRAYGTNGYWLADSNSYAAYQAPFIHNTVFYGQFPANYPGYGEEGFAMYSNTLPAAVEIQLGALEDTAVRRLESLINGNPGTYTNYLAQQANRVQMFRQRVSVPNCDPTAYQ